MPRFILRRKLTPPPERPLWTKVHFSILRMGAMYSLRRHVGSKVKLHEKITDAPFHIHYPKKVSLNAVKRTHVYVLTADLHKYVINK